MSDHLYCQWKWRPEAVMIVKPKNLSDVSTIPELKIPDSWVNQINQDPFVDNSEIIKQMEGLANGILENENWMEPVPINLF